MADGWYCMGRFQEVYVGGDNRDPIMENNVKYYKRAMYGGRKGLRPEYETSERYNKNTDQWVPCGGDVDCFYGYGIQGLMVHMRSNTYTKQALEVSIKCTTEEQVWIQVDPSNKKSGWNKEGKKVPRTWNINAKLTMFYNLAQITPKWIEHWGFQEHRLSAKPTDEFPVLRLEVERKIPNQDADFQVNVIVNKARVSVDSCMDTKSNHAQCLVELERKNPDTSLRSSHARQDVCLAGQDQSRECRDWKACLDDDTKDLIKRVSNAFSWTRAATFIQKQAKKRREASRSERRRGTDCKDGGHGFCVDPPSMDIESFDCNCFDSIKDMSQQELHAALCNHKAVCCEWKKQACSESLFEANVAELVSNNGSNEVLEANLERAATYRSHANTASGSLAASMDEALTTKKTCR